LERNLNRKLNTAKKTACSILERAGYKIEITNNNIFCITAMRKSEWRIIAIGIEEIIKCHWFRNQIKKLERLPNPSPDTINKEIWIREEDGYNFRLYFYENGQWVDEDLNPVNIF